jgi:hypothetical protein
MNRPRALLTNPYRHLPSLPVSPPDLKPNFKGLPSPCHLPSTSRVPHSCRQVPCRATAPACSSHAPTCSNRHGCHGRSSLTLASSIQCPPSSRSPRRPLPSPPWRRSPCSLSASSAPTAASHPRTPMSSVATGPHHCFYCRTSIMPPRRSSE